MNISSTVSLMHFLGYFHFLSAIIPSHTKEWGHFPEACWLDDLVHSKSPISFQLQLVQKL